VSSNWDDARAVTCSYFTYICVTEISSLDQQTGKTSHGIIILVVKYLHIAFLHVDILIHSVS